MPKFVGYAVFVLITAAAVYGTVQQFAEREENVSEGDGKLMFPQFKNVVNDTAKIVGVDANGKFTLSRASDQWVLMEKGNYPADPSTVNEMLIGLSQLKLLEKKTSKPQRYAKLGLSEPGSKDSDAQRITVFDKADKILLDVILGERKAARGEPNMSELYVRLPDDPQTWNALAGLPITTESVDWLNSELIKVDINRVRSVVALHEDTQVVTVVRTANYGQGYQLQNVPARREVDNEFVVRNIATTLANLNLDDVAKQADQMIGGKNPLSFALVTYDGLQITLNTVKIGDDRMVLLKASSAPTTPVPEAAATSKRKDDVVTILPPKEVKAQIDALNKRWSGYVFELADWRIAPSYKRKEELLKALPKAEPEKAKNAVQ